MGKWIYPELSVDDLRLGKAVIKDVPVSIKDLYNVCKALRGMKVVKAKEFLRRVERAEEAIPYWRYARGAGHRSNIATRWGVKAGRFPRKAVKYVLKVLESAENNAVSKGLDPETLKLVHIAAHKGPTLKRYVPRAFGRSSPKFRGTAHIEVVVMGE